MPTLTQDFLEQVPHAFGMDPKDELSKDEFKMLFDIKGSRRAGPQDSALKQKNARAVRDSNSEEYTTIIKYFAECLEEENLTPARFFKKADKNFNLVLTVDEIKDEIRNSLPNAFAGLNFKKLAKALDANNNGIIEQNEFISLLDNALGSFADTTQFQRISGAIGGKPGTAKPQSKENSVTLIDTVRPEDRINPDQLIGYLKGLMKVENDVKDPLDDIKVIFDKIQAWKEKMGDLEEQDKCVSKKLKPLNTIKVHNVKTALEKLNQLKAEINLTDEEIHIIIFTSLDFDWFTNLIVLQGEFRKWFDMNFEGESREELDFRENKQDIWIATTTMATEVITWHGRIETNHEVVLTTKWWEKVKYHHFGSNLKQKFTENPEL